MKVKWFLILFIVTLGMTLYFSYLEEGEQLQKLVDNKKDEVLEFRISALEIKQGEYISLIIKNMGSNSLRINANDILTSGIEIYKDGNDGYVYLPIAVTKLPGNYDVEIFKNESLVKSYVIKVNEAEFVSQNLIISEQIIRETTGIKAVEEYRNAISKAVSYNVKERLFEDNFILPVSNGRISTEFGARRHINNNSRPVIHYGIDIAASRGTLIKATASGKVVFSDYITSGGNYIIIDHGMGILSYYAHLDSRVVKEKNKVSQGDIIGYVGSTGYSTGPHLHFNITINQISVNPWLFIRER